MSTFKLLCKQVALLAASLLLVGKSGYCSEISYPLPFGSMDVFVDVLYWQASETIDWAYTKTTRGTQESIDFKTLSFEWDPGFRVGVGYNGGLWDTQFYYTGFYTQTKDSANGTVISGFLGSRFSGLGPYQSGEALCKINVNLLDWDLAGHYWVNGWLYLRPLIGIRGGWIDQRLNTRWQLASITAEENLKNIFGGAGPKVGLDTKWLLWRSGNACLSLLGDFSGSYLWGHWTISDKFEDALGTTVYPNVGNRHFGSFVLQGLLGFGMDCSLCQERAHLFLKLGYEISDWFNQYQILDNLTSENNKDLVLQGITFDAHINF